MERRRRARHIAATAAWQRGSSSEPDVAQMIRW